jgi:glyoxylate reductase
MSPGAAARPRVAVTRAALPGEGVARLAEHCDVVVWGSTAAPTPPELAALLADCDGALVLAGDRIDDALLAAADRLSVVSLASAGYDSVDVAAAAERGVVITNTPNVLAETTADIAMALILMARRRLRQSMQVLHSGGWGPFVMTDHLGLDVTGARLGLVGYGQIAQAVARRARGFGMRVHHYARTPRADEHSTPMDLETLLRTSDIVSLHVPLTHETAGLINAERLALMKPSATLVNTARGGVVDEDALLDALRGDRLHSAGLDVMQREPRSDRDDPLFAEPRLVVLPHIGSATLSTRSAMVDVAAGNILAVLSGEPAPNPVPGTADRPARADASGPRYAA